MKNLKFYIASAAIAIILSASFVVLWNKYIDMRADRDVYRSNNYSLMEKVSNYRVQDSLKAATVQRLELKLSEYEKYRADDMVLINELKVDKKRIESILTAQLNTAYDLKLPVRDSIIYRERRIVDTLRCVEYHDKWLDFTGCTRGDSSDVHIANRDSLIFVEHIVPKRFLGFLWKYGIKERRLEAVSKNKYTDILGIEIVTIRK